MCTLSTSILMKAINTDLWIFSRVTYFKWDCNMVMNHNVLTKSSILTITSSVACKHISQLSQYLLVKSNKLPDFTVKKPLTFFCH